MTLLTALGRTRFIFIHSSELGPTSLPFLESQSETEVCQMWMLDRPNQRFFKQTGRIPYRVITWQWSDDEA
jgi:hypothetical protein